MRRETSLGIDRSRATRAGSSDCLPIPVVDQITGGEGTLDAGGGRMRSSDHIPAVVDFDLFRRQFRPGIMPDRHEQAGGVEHTRLPCACVLDRQRRHPVVAVNCRDRGVRVNLQLRVLECPLLHHLRGPKSVTSNQLRDSRSKAGQESRLLDRRVSTPYDGYVLISEEEAVACAHHDTPRPDSFSSPGSPSLR